MTVISYPRVMPAWGWVVATALVVVVIAAGGYTLRWRAGRRGPLTAEQHRRAAEKAIRAARRDSDKLGRHRMSRSGDPMSGRYSDGFHDGGPTSSL